MSDKQEGKNNHVSLYILPAKIPEKNLRHSTEISLNIETKILIVIFISPQSGSKK